MYPLSFSEGCLDPQPRDDLRALPDHRRWLECSVGPTAMRAIQSIHHRRR
jgi:hypothetical protein